MTQDQNRGDCHAGSVVKDAWKPISRIAHVTSYLSEAGAGVKTVVEALSKAQETFQNTVRVFGLADEQWIERDATRWEGAPSVAMDVIGPRAIGYAPRFQRELASWNPTIIHQHGLWTYPSRVTSRVGRDSIPRVISPHGMLDKWALGRSRAKKRAALLLFERANLAGACLHALCEAERKAIRAFGIRGPIALIPNGVCLPARASIEPTASGHPSINPQKRTMLFLGRIHPKKGLPLLLTAIAECIRQKRFANWHLEIVGWDQSNHIEELKMMIGQLNLHSRVSLHGPAFGAEKNEILKRASLFTLPSYSEGLPMSVLEAWSYAVPALISVNCNLSKEASGGAGWVFEANHESLTNALNQVLSKTDAELRASGVEGQRLVTTKFTWNVVSRQFKTLYAWLQDDGPRPGFVSIQT